LNHSCWHLLPPIPDKLLNNSPGIPQLIAQLLFNRGLFDLSQLSSFLNADSRLSGDPFLLPDMHQAVARIYQALLSGENIAVYGDFDADGITATAILVKGLSILKGKTIPYIPHRLTEGHGLKRAALEQLSRQGISLVITVDCGITGFNEVKKARRIGLDIVITDHHAPPEELPPAIALVNPKLPNSNYPFSELAGVGVAFKLLQALFQSIGKERQISGLLDLVAIGTVADVMPLLGENRYLVKEGLKIINDSPRLGIKEILTQSGLPIGGVSADNISWIIAPRLNTASRLEHAQPSYELLMTDSPDQARQLAIWLEQKNAERQRITSKATEKAREQVLAEGIAPLLMIGGMEYPAGIAGLVAGKLTEEFYRPAVVVRVGKTISTGSCRSIPEFNIIHALNRCSRLFTQFGGHAQAAGFVLPTKNLPRLREALLEMADTELAGIDLRPKLDIDAEVTLSNLGGDTFQVTQQLAPFGQGNPVPTFLSRRVEVINLRTMGTNGEHIRLKLRQGDAVWDAVGFGLGYNLAEIVSPLDIVYNLEIDRWGGEDRLRLNIQDFAPAN
jgi:single-stranded-DNA-specific exonuclease